MNLMCTLQLEERVIPIDYEYCAYNYRAFDLANHFSEWMYDYSHGEHPFYRRTRRFFPDKERQVSERDGRKEGRR